MLRTWHQIQESIHWQESQTSQEGQHILTNEWIFNSETKNVSWKEKENYAVVSDTFGLRNCQRSLNVY